MTKIALLNWQREALKLWIENKGKGIVQAPTGSGKTFLALKLMQSENLYPFLIVVPTVELVSQWKERVRKYYPERGVITVGGGNKLRAFTTDVTITTVNSIRKENFKAKTLVLDEIHHYSKLAEVNYLLWNNINFKYVLGLSATPLPEGLSKKDVGWSIPLIYEYSLQQAYEDKVLLKPEILTKGVQLEEQEQSDYDILTEKIVSKSGSFGSFSNAPVWFKGWVFDRNEILFSSQMKLSKLREVISENSFKKCIVFTERIDTLNDIQRELSTLDIECLSIHSKMKKKERTEPVNRFINASEPVVLANAHIFEEGLDVPEVDLLVLYSFNNTRRESLQRIGRSLHNHIVHPRVHILYYQNTKETRTAKKIRKMFE